MDSVAIASSLVTLTHTSCAGKAGPATRGAIQLALDAASPGQTVSLPDCTILLDRALTVPAGVTLEGNIAQASDHTVLKRHDNRPGAIVLMTENAATLQNLYVDGVNQTAGTVTRSGATHPSGVAMVVMRGCTGCEVSNVKVVNAPAVGMELEDVHDVNVENVVMRYIGGIGLLVKSTDTMDPSTNVTITDLNARHIGTWYFDERGTGAGAGVAIAAADDVTIDGARITDSNGDGVASYSVSSNAGLVIKDSHFTRNQNHCAHAGGSDVVLLRNTCTHPKHNGLFVSTDWRDVDADGNLPSPISHVRVVDNTITMRAAGRGYAVKMANLDTQVGLNVANGNTISGGEHAFCFYDVDDVRLARNTATGPLHDYVSKPNSTVVYSTGHNANTFSGKKNQPEQSTCAR